MKYIYWILMCATITGHSALIEGPTDLPPSLIRKLPTHGSPARLIQLEQSKRALARARAEMQNPVARGQALDLFFQSLGLNSKPKTQSTVSRDDSEMADLIQQFSALSLKSSYDDQKK